MKRFRLSTLLLLVVIAALLIALGVSQNRAAQREAELRAQLNQQNLNAYSKKAYSVAPRNSMIKVGAPLRK
jgi:high-affinity Fe2+/Pb2+ permease